MSTSLPRYEEFVPNFIFYFLKLSLFYHCLLTLVCKHVFVFKEYLSEDETPALAT